MAKDDWRYYLVSDKTWLLDLHANHSPEDDYIDALDGVQKDPPIMSGIAMLNILTDRKKYVLEKHIWFGHSFSSIGSALGISKQRAHQIYWEAVDDLKDAFPTLDSLTLTK